MYPVFFSYHVLELCSLLIKNIQKKVYHFTPIVLVYRCIMCPSAVLFQSTSASTIWRNSKQNFSWGTKKRKKNHSFILSRALGHLPATRLLLLLKASKKQFDKSGFSEKIYRVSYFHSNELLPRNDKTMHSCYRSVSKFSEPQSIQMKQ